MLNLNKKNLFRLTFLISLFALISAYFIEYILGHQPCNLCLLERIPYMVALIIIIINFRFPLVDDGIEYMKDSNSKMKWDKWGNPYRVKMGRTQISLSQLNSSNIGVGNVHSTVTDLARFLG